MRLVAGRRDDRAVLADDHAPLRVADLLGGLGPLGQGSGLGRVAPGPGENEILVLHPDFPYRGAMTTALSERVAARARERIEARGLKKKALATALDISQSQAYSRISGRVAFDVDQLPDLAEFLGCRIEDLLLPDSVATESAA